MVANYRLYLTNDRNVVVNPDDCDFVPIFTPNATLGSNLTTQKLVQFSIKMLPEAMTIKENDGIVEITANLTFLPPFSMSDISAQIFVCLRAGNFLDAWSPLNFIPHMIREV
jgi:hypothetical protein